MKKFGFTIIEIAVVIAVIGVLSTIVVVSYGAVQGQVQTETAKTYALDVSKKLLRYASENGGAYPANLSVVGVSNGSATTYQYTVDNMPTPKTYCLTVTNLRKAAYIANGQSEATVGVCVGHTAPS